MVGWKGGSINENSEFCLLCNGNLAHEWKSLKPFLGVPMNTSMEEERMPPEHRLVL